MPTYTDPDAIASPVNGDKMGPLAAWFQLQAASVQAALTALRSDVEVPEYPEPLSVQGPTTQAVTATSWADLPGADAITLELPQACWVEIIHGAWMSSTSTGGDVRGSSRVTGATTLSENQLEVGGPSSAWGQVMYTGGMLGTRQCSGTRFVRLNAGTNTIRLRAYGSGTGKGMNYSTLQVTPIRWA